MGIKVGDRNILGYYVGDLPAEQYVGDEKARPDARAGIYWNKARGLLTVSDDGQNWITLSDKNQGALYDYFDGCPQTEDYYGSYFQRGNNYPFPWDGNIPVYHSQVDTTGYDWSNPYNSGEFRYPDGGSSRPNYSNPGNDALRGADSGLFSHKQGPCDSGFHVPTELEFNDLISTMETVLGGDYTAENFLYYLKLPCAGVRFGDANYSYPSQHNDAGSYWLSDCTGANPTNASMLMVGRGNPFITQSGRPVSGNSVRPFYNWGIAPEGGDWQVLYQPN